MRKFPKLHVRNFKKEMPIVAKNLDPTFGYTGEGTSSSGCGNYIIGRPPASPASAGTADSITAFITTAGFSLAGKCALYQASDNSFVAGTEAIPVSQSGYAWWIWNFAAPKPSITVQPYFIVIWGGGLEFRVAYDAGGAAGVYYDAEAYDGWPNPWVPAGNAARLYSIYCSYTPAAPPVVVGIKPQTLVLTL